MTRMLRLFALVLLAPASLFAAQLPYPMRKPLSDARSYLNQVELAAEKLGKQAAEWQPRMGDATLPLADVRQAVATLAKAETNLGYAENRFKELPLDHPEVAEAFQRVAPLKASLADSGATLRALEQSLTKMTDASSYPELRADLARLQEINAMFARPEMLEQNAAESVALLAQLPAVKAERQRLLGKYGPLMQQATPEGKNFQGVMRYFDERYGTFAQAAQVFGNEAPAKIKEQLAKVEAMASQAAKEKRSGFFGAQGGIAFELKQVEERLMVLTALLPPKDPVAAEMAKALQATRAFAAKQGESLQEAIIDGNRLPDETYAGPDKAALIAMIKEKWAKEGAPGEVMKVGINSTDWLRSQRLEWQGNSWVKYDSSSLQGFVAVKSGDFAVVYHLNFIKNHMLNDRVTLSLFDDPKEAPIVQRKVRLKNVR